MSTPGADRVVQFVRGTNDDALRRRPGLDDCRARLGHDGQHPSPAPPPPPCRCRRAAPASCSSGTAWRMHVGAHEGAVGVIVLEERDQRRGDRDQLASATRPSWSTSLLLESGWNSPSLPCVRHGVALEAVLFCRAWRIRLRDRHAAFPRRAPTGTSRRPSPCRSSTTCDRASR